MGLFDFMKSDAERAAGDAIRDAKTERESRGIADEFANDITRAASHAFESKEYKTTYDAVREATGK